MGVREPSRVEDVSLSLGHTKVLLHYFKMNVYIVLGKRNSRIDRPVVIPKFESMQTLRWPKEKVIHSIRISEKPSSYVLRRTHQVNSIFHSLQKIRCDTKMFIGTNKHVVVILVVNLLLVAWIAQQRNNALCCSSNLPKKVKPLSVQSTNQVPLY